MAVLKRVRCPLTGGGVVGPSVATFYFSSTATGFSADLHTFFQAIKAGMPDDLFIQVPNTGDTINDTNGTLAGVWTDSGGSTTQGTSSAAFALGAGARIRWVTEGVRSDRRVVGTTFLVPLASDGFQTSGAVSSTYANTVSTAAAALITAQSPDMLIWSKPHSKAAADGESNPIISAFVVSVPTGLRSRRT